jgi:cytochrome c-type biogenesis protein CcmH
VTIPDSAVFFWIAMAVLAVAASVPLLVSLNRERGRAQEASAAALAIYRDQLGEVDRDFARGLIGEAEATAARAEIGRRALRTGAGTPPRGGRPTSRGGRRMAAAAIVAMPVAALGLYLTIGAPLVPDQPLAGRLTAPPGTQDLATLLARVEEHLAASPGDGRGWEVVAPIYLRLGRFDDAVRAYSRALTILGATARRQGDLGEAIVVAAGGIVTEEARAAFQRARDLAPDDPRPRFFLALALGQEGRADEAAAAWRALVENAPADAPWLAAARRELAAIEAPPTAAGPRPGPSAADVEAAATMSAADRQTMIEGMVASLAARLAEAPGDADGWARLIRSYMVLDRVDAARAAWAQARVALADDAAGLALAEAEARAAGFVP